MFVRVQTYTFKCVCVYNVYVYNIQAGTCVFVRVQTYPL